MSAASARIPSTESEITTTWLRTALAVRRPEAVSTLELRARRRIGAEYGFAGELWRCELTGDGIPPSVVVKLWAPDESTGANEIVFYERVAPLTPVRVPACELAAFDPVQGRAVLVLEDFPGARQGDCLAPAVPDDARALARALAAIHARWWGRSAAVPLDALPSQHALDRDDAWYAARPDAFLARFGTRVSPDVRELVPHARAFHARSNLLLAGASDTLVHGDLHLDNVLFEHETGAPVILDWANIACGPAALDLSDLVYGMAPLEQFDELLEIYGAALLAGGVTPAEADPAALEAQLRGAFLRRFVRATCGIADWQPAREREQRVLDTEIERLEHLVAFAQVRHPGVFSTPS